MSEETRKTVVVAGASGFVGRALPSVLGDRYELIGLTRDERRVRGVADASGGYRWRSCDLFSRRQSIDALEGADIAIYLVHSMLPSADLSQGEFGDMDLICADNFARGADHHGVEHIVYVSELLGESQPLTPALASRHDVQSVLDAYDPELTALRAGFVIGRGGAGTQMLCRLVERLRVMLLPTWTSSRVAPIARRDLAELIGWAVEHPARSCGAFDVAGPELTTYRKMLATLSELMGRDCRLIRVPLESRRLSTHWISTVTGQPTSVVRPLVERFRQDLIPADNRFQKMAGQQPMSPRQALRDVCRNEVAPVESLSPVPVTEEHPKLSDGPRANIVRSVQRVALPPGRDARWVGEEYARWLHDFMGALIQVTVDDNVVRFFAGPFPWPLLILERDDDISQPQRSLFWIRGGLLAGRNPMARLEFRRIPTKQAVLTAIHQFQPRLPWMLYMLTQAHVHDYVMGSFGRHLKRLATRPQLGDDDGVNQPQ